VSIAPRDPKDPAEIHAMASDPVVQKLARDFFLATCEYRYSYHFSWLGRPVIQYPQDLIAMQELIWQTQPDLIVETGVAHGGSLIYYASLLELIGRGGLVAGIDVDIREHNRTAIESHPLARRIALIEGSSVAERVVAQVRELASSRPRVLVVLDSNHTHEHVLSELELYSPLVRSGSYIVVFDTVIEHMPASAFADRPWGPGNNPLTAVDAFLKRSRRFVQDGSIDAALLISAAPGGYLRCISD
jgi:cephalosporin hydroxylase